jgi:hypothetical protein
MLTGFIWLWFRAGLAQLVQWLGYGQDNRWIVVWFPAEGRDICLLHSVQMSHFSPVCIGCSFLEDKATAGWVWPASSAELKNEWSYTVSPTCLHGLDRDNFISAWWWSVQTDAEPSFSVNGDVTSLNKDCPAELVNVQQSLQIMKPPHFEVSFPLFLLP